tara:strand:+ start:606 stop:761 length:156 start_codon:yes stop_codon:yes gene_type:complete
MLACLECESTDIVQAVWIFANSEQLDGGELVDDINQRCWECGSEEVEDLEN